MNKIIVEDKIITLNNEEVDLDIQVAKLKIIVQNNVEIHDINNNKDLELEIVLADNSNLIYKRFNQNLKKYQLTITLNNNTTLEYNNSLITTTQTSLDIKANILGNNNKCIMNIYGVSKEHGSLEIKVDGLVEKNIKDNDLLENIRILMLADTKNIIIPNLLVSSDAVSVNHNATISSINSDYLFYLESKGLSEYLASKLIIKGFLLNKLKDMEVILDE